MNSELLQICVSVASVLLSAFLGVLIKCIRNGKAKKVLQESKEQLDSEFSLEKTIKEAVAYAEKVGGTPGQKLKQAVSMVERWHDSNNKLQLNRSEIVARIEDLVAYTKTVNAPATSNAKIMLELDEDEAKQLKSYLQQKSGGNNNEIPVVE